MSSRNLTHAMELAGVRKTERTDDIKVDGSKLRGVEHIEAIAQSFLRWRHSQFDVQFDEAPVGLLRRWRDDMRPMVDCYTAIVDRLAEVGK